MPDVVLPRSEQQEEIASGNGHVGRIPGRADERPELPLAANDIGMIVVDAASLEYLYANAAAARIRGFARSDEFVAHAANSRTDDDSLHLRAWLDDVLAGNHPFPEMIGDSPFAGAGEAGLIEITASAFAWAAGGAVLIEMRDVATELSPEPCADDDRGRASQILDAAPDAMLVLDGDGRIEQINAQAVTVFGYPAHELVGRPIEIVVPFELQQMHRQQRTSYADNDAPGHMSTGPNVTAVRKDGSTVAVEVNLSMVTLSTGLTILASVRDVTESRRHERELARARDFFRSVLNGASQQTIIATDTSGRITMFSEGASRMTGYTENQMLGNRPLILHDPQEVATRANELGILPGFEVFSRRPSGGSPETREWTYLTAEGERLTVVLSVVATRDAAARLTGYVGVANDITERKRMENQLRDSEQRFRLAFDDAPIGMFLTDLRCAAAGRILRVNRALCELTGRAESDLLASNVVDLFPSEARVDLEAVLAELVGGAALHWDGELRYLRSDGQDVWGHVAVSVACDADGRPAYAISQLADTTARKRNEEHLEERFRELSNNVEVGFTLHQVDPPDTLYANPAYHTIFGFDPCGPTPSLNDAIGRILADDRLHLVATIELLTGVSGRHVSEELRVQRPDGTIRWIHVALTPVAQDDGTVRRVAGIYEDITERRAADADARAARIEAEQANAAKDEFLSRVGHELRTPLNAVLGFAQLLDFDILSSSQKQAVAHILRGGENLLAVINNILDITLIEADAVHPARQPALHPALQPARQPALKSALQPALKSALQPAVEPGYVTHPVNDLVTVSEPLATSTPLGIDVGDAQPGTKRRPRVQVARAQSSVLYIEDNVANVELLSGILRWRPTWAAGHAGTGARGLQLAAATAPTVILLDLHLPDMDGIDVLCALRARPGTARTPVAVLSADASPGQIKKLLAAGAQVYLTKPVDVRQVLTFLDAHAL